MGQGIRAWDPAIADYRELLCTNVDGTYGILVTKVAPGGIGDFAAVPAGSTDGTPLGTLPADAIGVVLYLQPGDSVTCALATVQPVSAPVTVKFSNASGATSEREVPIGFQPGQNLYVTATTGTPSFRYF